MSKTIPQHIDSFLDDIQAILLSFLVKLGPFFVALMPALFTGYAIFHTFEPEAGYHLSLAFALVVGLAIETVGIVATHTAIDLYNGWRSKSVDGIKVLLMVGMVPFYVAGVAGTVLFAQDAFSPLVWGLGIASPFLTCIVYIAVALARDLSNIKQKVEQGEQFQIETEKRKLDHELTMELQRMKLSHEQKLRRAELETEVKKEQVRAMAEVERTKAEVQRKEPDDSEQSVNVQDIPPEYDQLLAIVRERSAGKPFGAGDVQQWLNRGKTSTYDLLSLGQQTGEIHQVGRGRYILNGAAR
jgi:hypothetical protein